MSARRKRKSRPGRAWREASNRRYTSWQACSSTKSAGAIRTKLNFGTNSPLTLIDSHAWRPSRSALAWRREFHARFRRYQSHPAGTERTLRPARGGIANNGKGKRSLIKEYMSPAVERLVATAMVLMAGGDCSGKALLPPVEAAIVAPEDGQLLAMLARIERASDC